MKQKDWLIYGAANSNLFFLSVEVEGDEMEVLECESLMNLGRKKLKEAVDAKYQKMLQSMGSTDYEYVVGSHKFSEEDLSESKILSKVLSASKVSEVEVSSKALEKELSQLLKKEDVIHKGKKSPDSLDDLKEGNVGSIMPSINIEICNNIGEVKDKYSAMCDDDKAALQEIELIEGKIKETMKVS